MKFIEFNCNERTYSTSNTLFSKGETLTSIKIHDFCFNNWWKVSDVYWFDQILLTDHVNIILRVQINIKVVIKQVLGTIRFYNWLKVRLCLITGSAYKSRTSNRDSGINIGVYIATWWFGPYQKFSLQFFLNQTSSCANVRKKCALVSNKYFHEKCMFKINWSVYLEDIETAW